MLSFLAASYCAFGQGVHLPIDNPANHILDRLAIKTGLPAPFHLNIRYFTRGDAALYALQLDTSSRAALSRLDRLDLRYIFRDNNEWLGQATFATTLAGPHERADSLADLSQVEVSMADPRYEYSQKPIFKVFYRTPANLLEVNEKFFNLRANPIINFNLNRARGDQTLLFFNQRGLELRGGVDDRIYFYTNILETQARFPEYVNDYINQYRAIPGAGFFKRFRSVLFNFDRGYDFLNGQGYLGLNITRHVGMQFGYGRNFLGNGYRSLFLSDFANNYLYLRFNWRVWKFHYQNLFTEMAINSSQSVRGDVLIDRKYMAAHYLSFEITPNLSVGIFDAVVFSRPNQFELHYLNPFILYRVIEQAVGSPDNAMVGLDARWNLWKRFQIYGQIIFDEFKFQELVLENRGWWANKYGIQTGLKYIDAFGVDHLDLRAEYNLVRPYTFTHRDSTASYAHYHQALAHPLGANFREWILMARYQPLHRLVFDARLIGARFGEDENNTNWGANILIPNISFMQTYDNFIGQGVGARTLLFGLDISYMLAHNVFLDLQYFQRRKRSDDPARDQSLLYLGGGLRVNIGRTRMDF
jgi:hypothetical protein